MTAINLFIGVMIGFPAGLIIGTVLADVLELVAHSRRMERDESFVTVFWRYIKSRCVPHLIERMP